MIKLKKVISGGQTGADEAALVSAKAAGLETGGWMPIGFMTEEGRKPEYKEEYGMKEYGTKDYRSRTYANVKDSDATLRIAGKLSSGGEKCTLNAIHHYKKPHLSIKINNESFQNEIESHADKIVEWLSDTEVEVLNVAGNREGTWPGIQNKTLALLQLVFEKINADN